MNILLTSAGRRSYLVEYFKDALSGKGLVHAGNSKLSPALLVADKLVLTPEIYSNGYISFLIDYCRQQNISVIIPLFDVDLPILSKAKEIFKREGITVVVSDYIITKLCNDKWKSYNFLQQNGIKTPRTFLEFQTIQKEMLNEQIGYPLVVKPRWGMGSIEFYLADSAEELKVFYDKANNNVKKTYAKYESIEDMKNCVLIQEYLDGIEYGLDVVNDLDGRYVTTFVKRKLAIREGEAHAAITEYNPTMENIGFNISKLLRHVGVLDIDCFLCGKEIYIIDMNPRFGGLYAFSHLAGANIPDAIIKWLNREIPDQKCFKIKYGITGEKDYKLVIY